MARETAQQRKVRALLEQLEPKVALAFRDAIYAARKQVDLAALIDALDRGDIIKRRGICLW